MSTFTFLSRALRPPTRIPVESPDCCISLKLMRLCGLISSDSNGVHAFRPDLFRSLRKLENLVDEKMIELGAQRILLPTLGPRYLWEKSGRWSSMQSCLFKLKDRLSHEYCLQPTHEECVTNLVASLQLAHKDLPLLLYQITSKFRDEPHPKNGLIRGREFLMQDLYTFDTCAEAAGKTYIRMKTAYMELFNSLKLPLIIACADPGNVGGEVSDEFHIPSSVGEDKILACPECNLNMNADLRGNDTQSKCTLESCPKVFQQVQAVEVAHCFLLGERYSKCFDATYQSTTGPKLLFMGCYGLGISRLLAVCIEHFTRASFPDKSAEKITQLRWPVQIAPYCGAIVFQKETAKDALNAPEQKSILDVIQSHPVTIQMPGDILVDDRKGLSLGRKVLDISRLGVPWILIAKGNMDTYELVDVYEGRSCAVTLEQAKIVFNNPATFNSSSLPSWKRE